MENVQRRIPLYRFGYIEYQRGKGAVSGSFEFGVPSAVGGCMPSAAGEWKQPPRSDHEHQHAKARR